MFSRLIVCLSCLLSTLSLSAEDPYAISTEDPYAISEFLPEDPSGWYAHTPYIEEIFKQNDIHVVVEVGSRIGGGSTRHIAGLLKAKGGVLYAVDTWLGSSEHQPGQQAYNPILPKLYEQFISNMIRWDLKETVIPMRMDSVSAARILKITPDFIYIDGEHSMAAVYADLTAWYPFIENRGIICGDDWGWETVRRGVELFAYERKLNISTTPSGLWSLQK